MIRVCSYEDVARDGVKVVSVEGRTVALFTDHGKVYALDNRCPHMGFPLHRGTVKNGILTCHWHHARFDLAGGCTFDPFADDVPSFPVEVKDGGVWVDPRPMEEKPREHWLRKLDEGLEQSIDLVLAKSALGLDSIGAARNVITRTALFGVRNRDAGWSTGMTVLSAMASIRPSLDPADRPLALYCGLTHVAGSTANQPPKFALAALRTTEARPERYMDWFRHSIDVRAASGAERALRTAISLGLSKEQVAGMVFAACTDHLYLDVGHTLDFANKAFELLEHIGWEHAAEVLCSLVPGLAQAQRMEEASAWREPIDLAALLRDAHRDLDAAIEAGSAHAVSWQGHRDLAARIMEGPPAETLSAMLDLVRAGAPLTDLSQTVAYAAAMRAVHFHTSNSFFDWDTVHHAFTYANAVDRAMRRAPSRFLARGVFDGAVAVYLQRFLNVPKQPLPRPAAPAPSREEVLAAFDRQGQVDEAGRLAASLAHAGRQDEAIQVLGHALLREDSGFHEIQMYEAGLRQYRQLAGSPMGDHILIGVARYLAAHSPTARTSKQTYDIAARLHRGEALYGEDG